MANEVAVQKKQGIASFLASDAVKANVMSVVGEKDAQRFISSVVSAVQTNPQLAECTNTSILSAALLGHSLNLPQSPQLGYFYMVPYKGKNGTEAQFQISYRGLVQLAMRSGQYKKIVVVGIKEGELEFYSPITEEFRFNAIEEHSTREAKPTIGYYAMFELVNGFKKEMYWSVERMESHAKKYSAAYRKGWDSCLWKSDFDAMAYKTMLKQIISKWGIMSVEMEKAYTNDQAVIDENGNPEYVDNVPDEPEKAVDVMADAQVTEITEETDEKSDNA